MKNKIQFIIPRLLVVTAVVGIISLIIGAIFKILLLATILFSVGSLIYAKIKRNRMKERFSYHFDKSQRYYLPQTNQAIVPVQYSNRSTKATIIPIY